MTTGRITHHLMQARELTEGRAELDLVRYFIDSALRIVRQIHRQ